LTEFANKLGPVKLVFRIGKTKIGKDIAAAVIADFWQNATVTLGGLLHGLPAT